MHAFTLYLANHPWLAGCVYLGIILVAFFGIMWAIDVAEMRASDARASDARARERERQATRERNERTEAHYEGRNLGERP